MGIDTSKINQKVPINIGDILFDENTNAVSLNILHEGSLVYEKKIKNKKLPLLESSGKNLTPGVISLFHSGKYPFSIKASSDCMVSTYNVNMDTIRKTISSKMAIGSMIAKTLFMEISEISKKANFIKNHNANLEKLIDNLSISYYFVTPSSFPDIKTQSPANISEFTNMGDPVMDMIRRNLKTYLLSGGLVPEKMDIEFVRENKGGYLSKEYSNKVEVNDLEMQFIRKIVNLKSELTNQIFTEDISILIHICEKLSEFYVMYMDEYNDIIERFYENLYTLCGGSSSLIEKYYLVLDLANSGIGDLSNDSLSPIMDYISFTTNSFLNTFKSNFMLEFPELSPNLVRFQESASKLSLTVKPIVEQEKIAASTITIVQDYSGIKKELENSASKILSFAGTPIETVKEFSSLVMKLKTMKNPLDPEPDARKIRKNIGKIYWEVYEKSLLKYFASGRKVPKPVKMMLLYGYIDETLLEDDQLAFLFNQADKEERSPKEASVFEGVEWLEDIYNRKITTSMDGLGQTFFEKVKMETKDQLFKKESDLPSTLDNGNTRLSYELSSMYSENVRLTTGNPTTHLAILTKYQINMPLDKCFVSKKMLIDTLKEILAIDYTAFSREVIFNDNDLGIRGELIWTNVAPDFIFVPSLGDKIMMWQVLSIFRGAGSKESKGRIVLPRFVTYDLKTLLTEAIGSFRWELTKEILGPDWNNPQTPSITSHYMDYIQFYKKNKDISIEVKEKISEEFKRFRSDKDKFINDYVGWVKAESEGIQKLNKVVRNIFYRFIPFAPAIREKVSKMPAYIDIHNRFVNIRNRDYKERENRYRKYMAAPGGLPKKLQENLDYYKV